MSHQEDFVRLETIVEKLLSTVDELRREKVQMQEAMRQKEEKLLAARQESDSLHEERDEILSRVNRLIGTLEEWESGEEKVETESAQDTKEKSVPTVSMQED